MVTYEKTEETPNGLDFLIKATHGGWLAWAYNEDMAKIITNALNEYNPDN